MATLSEVRHGDGTLRAGDLVRVVAGKARADSFVGRFLFASADRGGMFYRLVELDSHGNDRALRSVTPARCRPVAARKALKNA